MLYRDNFQNMVTYIINVRVTDNNPFSFQLQNSYYNGFIVVTWNFHFIT